MCWFMTSKLTCSRGDSPAEEEVVKIYIIKKIMIRLHSHHRENYSTYTPYSTLSYTVYKMDIFYIVCK